jgi:hypothetical protein
MGTIFPYWTSTKIRTHLQKNNIEHF